jgi:hypothetical protein
MDITHFTQLPVISSVENGGVELNHLPCHLGPCLLTETYAGWVEIYGLK